MNNKLIKLAFYLKERGLIRQSQQVLNLLDEKRKRDLRKDHNKQILDRLKGHDRVKSIVDQHQQDLSKLRSSEPSELAGLTSEEEVLLPQPARSYKRYRALVRYPNFDESGKPYFDETCIEETLALSEEALSKFKADEQKGYCQILSEREIIPKGRV